MICCPRPWSVICSAVSRSRICPRARNSGLLLEVLGGTSFLLPGPNSQLSLPARSLLLDLYGGVTCNPMYWPARKPETLLQRAVYKWGPPELQRRRLQDLVRQNSDEDFTGASMKAAMSCQSARVSC